MTIDCALLTNLYYRTKQAVLQEGGVQCIIMHKSNFNLLTYELTSHVFAPFYRIIAVGQPQIHDPSSGQAVYKESCCVHAFLAMDPLSMCWRNIYMSYTVDVDWRRPTSMPAKL